MTVRLKYEPNAPTLRAPQRKDATVEIPSSAIGDQEDLDTFFQRLAGDVIVEVESLTPEIATRGVGGALLIHQTGKAKFAIRSRRVRFIQEIDVTAAGSPPPEPPPEPPPVPPSDPPVVSEPYIDELLALLNGVTAGAASMEVFADKDHATATYTRNPNMWAAPLTDQLSSAVIWKSLGALESYGGILISPRHVLYCQHAHPWAANTWPVNLNSNTPCELRWVLADNTTVSAIQIAQSDTNSARPGFNGPTLDLCVAVLDRDVQALGVPVMPVLGITPDQFEANGLETGTLLPITPTQGALRPTSVIPPIPTNDYPQYHQPMIAYTTWPSMLPSAYATTDLAKIHYRAWDGDSGTPVLHLVNGTFYLRRILSGGDVTTKLADINLLLEGAENYAIQLGRLAEPTGTVIVGVIPPGV